MAKFIPPGLVPVGSQRSVLSNSTAVALNSTLRASAKILDISVETKAVRMLASSNPTLTTGVLITTTASPFRFYDYNGTSSLKFQRSTGTATINVQGYRYAR